MKRFLWILLSALLVISISCNIFVLIKNNSDTSKRTANTITEILRCISDTKESLQNLIDSEDSSNKSNMMYVINGRFSTLYHLCHANRYIYSNACSDFEFIGATLIGAASNRNFITTGIYEDFEITQEEYEYIQEILNLLDRVDDNITGADATKDLHTLNSNLEDMHEQLYDIKKSPYRLIQKKVA